MISQLSHLRHHEGSSGLGAPFGTDSFGRFAERFARMLGAPPFLIGQTLIVIAWIALNGSTGSAFDPFPFILLNLAFSTQAAYAAPLILLAQTRQADRDRAWTDADARHREELSERTLELLQQNTAITEQVAALTQRIEALTSEIHGRVVADAR